DLHRAALLLGRFLGQVLRSERCSGQAVATRGRTDVKYRVADAFGGATRDLFVTQDSQAECVHQWVPFVALVEIDLARDRRDAEAIAVMGDAADDAGEEAAVIVNLRFAICDFGGGACAGVGSALSLALAPWGER